MKRWYLGALALVVGCFADANLHVRPAGWVPPEPMARAHAQPSATLPPVDCRRMQRFSTCAIGLAGLLGRVAGSALACKFGAQRVSAVVTAATERFRSVSLGPEDTENATIAFRSEIMFAAQNTPAKECGPLAATFADLERSLGLQ